MKKINIIAQDNGVGLGRDVAILMGVLREAGFDVTHSAVKSPPLHERLFFRRPRYDVNIFVEHVRPRWFSCAHKNCMIPNPEWFRQKWHKYLGELDLILCKSRSARDTFAELGCKSEYISFTSMDRREKKYKKDFRTFFHLAGKSKYKGTGVLIDLWSKHPEWPLLTIVQNPFNAEQVDAPNIRHITEHVEERLLLEYQNSHGIHLCPSESEGFGHYIVEAMSCGALVLTTNASPMNELVSSDRGVLVNFSNQAVNNLGTSYYADVKDLELKLSQIIAMDNAAKKLMGEKARAWYEENNLFFEKEIARIIEEV